jgi:hypothetical protein
MDPYYNHDYNNGSNKVLQYFNFQKYIVFYIWNFYLLIFPPGGKKWILIFARTNRRRLHCRRVRSGRASNKLHMYYSCTRIKAVLSDDDGMRQKAYRNPACIMPGCTGEDH